MGGGRGNRAPIEPSGLVSSLTDKNSKEWAGHPKGGRKIQDQARLFLRIEIRIYFLKKAQVCMLKR